ncbi:hypothetical protein JW865_02325 [Candidatus Bathyarchaeota archaeon]|nr:hypothetical protein [Candidatus Bathyarchaeota archaeon]
MSDNTIFEMAANYSDTLNPLNKGQDNVIQIFRLNRGVNNFAFRFNEVDNLLNKTNMVQIQVMSVDQGLKLQSDEYDTIYSKNVTFVGSNVNESFDIDFKNNGLFLVYLQNLGETNLGVNGKINTIRMDANYLTYLILVILSVSLILFDSIKKT